MIGKSLDIGSSVIRFFSKNFYTLILFALVLISAFSSIWLFYFEIVKDTNPLSSIPAHIVKTLFDAMVLMSPFFCRQKTGIRFYTVDFARCILFVGRMVLPELFGYNTVFFFPFV